MDRQGNTVVLPTFDTIVSDFGTGYNGYLSSMGLGERTDAGIRYYLHGPDGWATTDGSRTVKIPKLDNRVFGIIGLGDGLLLVIAKGSSAGIFDLKGRFKGDFDDMLMFAGISEGLIAVKKDGKWGYADRTGHIVISPTYDAALAFSEGMAAVVLKKKWGYVDRAGKLLIEPKFNVAGVFRKGRASVFVGRTASYINRDGEAAFPKTFSYAEGFFDANGLARVKDTAADLWGFIDRSGNYAIPPTLDGADDFFEGLAAVRCITGTGTNKAVRAGYMNAKGELVVPVDDATEMKPFSNGLAWVKTRSGGGYIDRNAKWIWRTPYEKGK
jgi:hypothetical protein